MPSKHQSEIDEKGIHATRQKYSINYQLQSMIIAVPSPMQPSPVGQQGTCGEQDSNSNKKTRIRVQRRRLSCRPWQLRVFIDVGGAPWPRPRTEKASLRCAPGTPTNNPRHRVCESNTHARLLAHARARLLVRMHAE